MRVRSISILGLLLILLTIYFASPAKADACSPDTRIEPDKAEGLADVVFEGEVVSVSGDPLNLLSPYREAKSLLFEVTSTWKGIDQSQAIVQAWDNACGAKFRVFSEGDHYVVFATLDRQQGSLVDEVILPQAKAQEYLVELGPGTPPTQEVKLEQPLTLTSVVIAGCFIVPAITALAIFFMRRAQRICPE